MNKDTKKYDDKVLFIVKYYTSGYNKLEKPKGRLYDVNTVVDYPLGPDQGAAD